MTTFKHIGVNMAKTKKSYSKKELEGFKKLLVDRRAEILKDVDRMSEEVLHRNREDASTQDISGFADLGTENFEQEIKLGLIESEQEELSQIDDSLERIESGSYGRCLGEGCGELIPKNRLNALPFVTLCLDCKTKEEESN